MEVEDAKGSQALFVMFWIGRTRFLEVPGEHSASMDKKCSEVTQADRAGDRGRASLGKEYSEESPPGASCPKECQQAIQSGVESLGDSLQQGKFLSRDPYSSGATAEGLFEVVTAPTISDVC